MPMFAKRHYEAIAAKLKESRPFNFAPAPSSEDFAVACHWNFIVLQIGDVFRQDNPRFNRSTFHVACGFDIGTASMPHED